MHNSRCYFPPFQTTRQHHFFSPKKSIHVFQQRGPFRSRRASSVRARLRMCGLVARGFSVSRVDDQTGWNCKKGPRGLRLHGALNATKKKKKKHIINPNKWSSGIEHPSPFAHVRAVLWIALRPSLSKSNIKESTWKPETPLQVKGLHTEFTAGFRLAWFRRNSMDCQANVSHSLLASFCDTVCL